MKKQWIICLVFTMVLMGCTSNRQIGETQSQQEDEIVMENRDIVRLPEEIIEIPDEYYTEMDEGGTLVDLNYDTYESFSYSDQTEILHKRAVVYLPKGYDENQKYNVLYLMHGGWSDETVYLGSVQTGKSAFANVLDRAIENGDIDPLIVVSPTYNNTSTSDSGDYSLAIQLTENYHNELINDLIPAVIRSFSTYASDDSYEAITASRDHRAFAGFSMGSVATWRTFSHNLDAFKYFMPSSGNVGNNGQMYQRMVKEQGYEADDFFIFAATGTEDFAYQSFRNQIAAMADNEMFTLADNEYEGNLYYLEKEGYRHDGLAAMTYFYNGLTWLWKNENRKGAETTMNQQETQLFTLDSTVNEVQNDPAFKDFGHLLFPVDRPVNPNATLQQISTSSTYLWYSNIQPDKTVEIVNYLKEQSKQGSQIFYPIYTEEEIENDPSKANTGLFFFRGRPGEKFAIMNAGGGFVYVGAMHDSFPHALEVSKQGYNAFALIYNPQDAFTDLARAITFIYDHAEELQVDPYGYSLWGGSAGARMAATLGNATYLQYLTNRNDIPYAKTVVMQYTGYTKVMQDDAPTYVNVGTNDGIADWRTMKNRLQELNRMGIPTEFHVYDGLSHGYGLGTGTIADGWINDALRFWQEQTQF